MSWETFEVVQGNDGDEIADGQMNFTCTINSSGVLTAAELQYNPSSAPNPPPANTTIIFNLVNVAISLNADGTYHLPDASPPTFNIPPKNVFKGGGYNTMTGCTYQPTTKVISGTFEDQSTTPGDDPCAWTATASSVEEVAAKKAAY
jgi:hypothetical protein